MADMLIRGLDEQVVEALDAEAQREGLSRNELVKRRLTQGARAAGRTTSDDLRRFADVFADARDPQIMGAMWRHRPPG